MRGHEPLLAMRRARMAPEAVFIDTDAGEPARMPAWLAKAIAWQNVDASSADLEVMTAESIGRLDLRCLIGLRVFVSGTSRERVHAMRDACLKARASRVIASVLRRVGIDDEFPAFVCDELTDSAEEVTHG